MYNTAGRTLYTFTKDDEHYRLYIPDTSSQSKLFYLVEALGVLPQCAQVSLVPEIPLCKRRLFHSEYDRVARSVLALKEEELDEKWANQEGSTIVITAGITLAHKDVGRNQGAVNLDKCHMTVPERVRDVIKRQIDSRWAPDDVYVSGQVFDVETYLSSTDDLIAQAKSALIEKDPWHKSLYDVQVFRGKNQHVGLCVIPVFLKMAWAREWDVAACTKLKRKFIDVLENKIEVASAIQTGINPDMGLVSRNLCSPAEIAQAFRDGCEIAAAHL